MDSFSISNLIKREPVKKMTTESANQFALLNQKRNNSFDQLHIQHTFNRSAGELKTEQKQNGKTEVKFRWASIKIILVPNRKNALISKRFHKNNCCQNVEKLRTLQTDSFYSLLATLLAKPLYARNRDSF